MTKEGRKKLGHTSSCFIGCMGTILYYELRVIVFQDLVCDQTAGKQAKTTAVYYTAVYTTERFFSALLVVYTGSSKYREKVETS